MPGENEETTEPPPPQEIFQLDLHSWITAQQTLHGVRHDDYAQYHGYCTRRLHRLSHLPDAKKHLVCSSKYAANKAPKRHAYCSRIEDTLAAEYVPHENVLWYLLVLSERAWAQSKELAKQGKRRQQILAKLKRAVKWSVLLLQKAQVACDSSTREECRTYVAWMKANYALEQLDYQTASQEYAEAMDMCYKLSQEDGADETLRLERQDLFITRADAVLRPLFRYCQYELKQAGQELTVEEPRLASSSSVQATDEETLEFRGTKLVLEAKELRVLLLKLDSSNSEQKTEESFLNALSILDDAMEVVAKQLASLDKAQAGPAVQAKVRQYLLWKGYLQYQKTIRVMDHTSQLLNTVKGHAERVHIYDALLQHAKSLLQLPRPSDMAEEEDEFALQAQANVLRLRALKTLHMSWYYLQVQNIKAAWALVEQSSMLCKRAQEEITACDEDMPHADEYLEELEGLPYSSARAAIQAAAYLQNAGGGAANSKAATRRPLLLRLEDEDPGMVLADDLAPMPIPCKPVFYDLALYDTLDTASSLDILEKYVDKHTVKEEVVETTQSKGLLGRLFG